MVLSILSLATRPCLTRRRLSRSMFRLRQALLADHGLNARVDAPNGLHAAEIRKVPGAQLKAQVEKFFPRLVRALLQLRDRVVAQLLELVAFHATSVSDRIMILVAIGSLADASLSASRATLSGTPAISKSTRPGRTTATQNSGLPLPEPMRTSAGFLVTDLSGKTLIQTLPPRLMWRVSAIRAASIWRLVIQHGSSACNPYSPKVSELPVIALPVMRPRWTLRHLTRFGVSMVRSVPRWGRFRAALRSKSLSPALRLERLPPAL